MISFGILTSVMRFSEAVQFSLGTLQGCGSPSVTPAVMMVTFPCAVAAKFAQVAVQSSVIANLVDVGGNTDFQHVGSGHRFLSSVNLRQLTDFMTR